jgi:polysaccharide chain length determinant protein (PEP-CTERM system associated)
MSGLFDEIRIALHAIWRRRWLALGIAWAICLAGWLVVASIPNRYESQARISVQAQSLLADKIGVDGAQSQKDIEQIRQTLASAVNLQKVVRGTDLNLTVANDRDMASRVEALRQSIKIVAQQDNLFQITASSGSPGLSDAANARLARAIVQKLIDIFVEQNLSDGREESSQTLKFLDAQLAERSQQLQQAEAKRAEFEAQFLGSLPGTGSVADRMDAARGELSRIDSDLAAAQSALAAVNGQMAGTAATVAGAPGAAAVAGPARTRVASIEGQIADGRAKGWTDQHPDMVALNAQLAQARAAAGSERVSVGGGAGSSANPLYLSLRSMQADRQAAVAALMARKAQIRGDIDRYLARSAADPAVAAQAGRVSQDYAVLKDQYDKLLADREQIALRGQAESQTDPLKFQVIDPPSAPRLPAAPNRPLLLTIVLVAGVGGGIGTAFALSKLQTTFPNAQRLERASGMPVIGSISEVRTAAQRAASARQTRWLVGGGAALAGAYVLLLLVEFVQRGMVA